MPGGKRWWGVVVLDDSFRLTAMRLLRFLFVPGVLCFGGVALVLSAAGQSASVTALAVTSGGSVVTMVKETTEVTLTATVTVGGSAAAAPGQVNFCEVKAPPLKCTDIRLLGTVQLSSSGTAVFHFFPGPGSHTYQSQFQGTHGEAASSSGGAALVVTPFYPTATMITAGGSPGNYTLTAMVTSTEGTVPPTGTISFEDTSNGSYVLATAPLVGNPAPPAFSFVTIPGAAAGKAPVAMASADFNGDGEPDLAIMGVSANAPLSVSLGNGNGTFAAAPSTPLPIQAFGSATTGDFNGDGKMDLAVVAEIGMGISSQNQVEVLLGNGDGSFKLGQQVSNVNGDFITTGDFNGDGIADLAVTLAGPTPTSNGAVAILLGNGDGTFTLESAAPTVLAPEGLTTGDFNGDGKADLAVVNQGGTVTILLGNGDGTFTPGQVLATGDYPISLAAADLNGDGILDLAVANSGIETSGPDIPGTVAILLGNGDGTFTQSPATPTVGTIADSIAVGDFNGDGKPDLVATSDLNMGSVYVLLGNGDGTYAPALKLAAGNAPDSVIARDFNGDGLSDIAVGENNNASAAVLLSQAGPQSATAIVSRVSPVGTGTHLVEASYPGDGGYQPSVSGTVGLMAEQVPTTLTLTGTPGSAMFGQQVVLTATVVPGIAQGHTPSGTVTFKNGSTVLGTGTVTSGVATLNTTSLPTGTDSLTAVYSGDTNFLGSTGSAMEVVAGIASVTGLTVVPNPAGTGQTVTLTAAVTGAGATPTGTVTFYDGGSVLGTATLDATGHAAFSTAGLALGAHNLTAVYAGDATYASSSSPVVVETIETPGFTIALSSSSLTLKTHGTGSDTVTLASFGSFADALALSCVSPPAYVTCSFKPNPAALSANGTASVSLSLNTNALIAEERGASGFSLALLLAPVSLLAVFGGRRRVRLRMLLAVVAVPLMLGLGSCGGNVIYPVASTAPGVYTISVMATGTASGLVQSARLTLTVTP